jgi:hypothetical protein
VPSNNEYLDSPRQALIRRIESSWALDSIRDFARLVRHRDLEHDLCKVHGDQRIVLHEMGSFLCLNSNDSGTSRPIESREESISSVRLTRRTEVGRIPRLAVFT